jgi:hypothetical protein
MDIIRARLGFCYKVIFVPKGARQPRTEYILGQDFVGIRSIKAAEADRVFRIDHPEIRGGKPWSHRKATSAEILSYAGELWWPLMTNPARQTRMTVAECLGSIASGILLERPCDRGRLLEVKLEEPELGVIKYHGYESELPIAQRKIYENVLVSGRKAYCRGGEPVYVAVPHRRSKSWRMSVVSAGTDRSVVSGTRGLANPPGNGAAYSTQRAFRDGRVYRADDFDSARAATANGASAPRIEILQPKAVSASPSEIQLDALFRFAIEQLAKWSVSAKNPETKHGRILREVQRAFEREGDVMTSPQRLSVLTDFAASLETNRYRSSEFEAFSSSLQSFLLDNQRSNGVQQVWTLEPEDEAALRGM